MDNYTTLNIQLVNHNKAIEFYNTLGNSKTTRKLIAKEKAAIKVLEVKFLLLGKKPNNAIGVAAHNINHILATFKGKSVGFTSTKPDLFSLDYSKAEKLINDYRRIFKYPLAEIQIKSIAATGEKINKRPIKLFQDPLQLHETKALKALAKNKRYTADDKVDPIVHSLIRREY